jgi:hypothetical protein
MSPPHHHHATATTLALATTMATKIKGNIWVNGQWLAAVEEDGWWWGISLFIKLIVPQKKFMATTTKS